MKNSVRTWSAITACFYFRSTRECNVRYFLLYRTYAGECGINAIAETTSTSGIALKLQYSQAW